MRVIAGAARGHVLKRPRGNKIRPTSDRIKEALFNIIAPIIKGATVLDLFAGIGSLGIESLSRGAAKAVFVDRNRDSIKLIHHNLALTGLSSNAEVYSLDVDRSLGVLKHKGLSFNLVFLDPPYQKGLITHTLEGLAKSELLLPAGLVVVEHSRREELPAKIQSLQLWRQRHYGDTVVSFYTREEDNA
ncbi:MAG: 16S rRNA (guanine(966)-N(2))-methyltransferase RsmD [Firmicutes bacterium]|nr:16S rRNA (guanine(966)-N(2))-methyltransferase RsmD [Bacillota bacterium]